MAVPTEDKVDFRAACFCHKKIIDVGFICSICLSSRYSLAQQGMPSLPPKSFLQPGTNMHNVQVSYVLYLVL